MTDLMESVYHPVTAIQPEQAGYRTSSLTLLWNPHDPVAVTWIFPRNIWWVTSLDLLTSAVYTAEGVVGDGDVRFCSLLAAPDTIVMELRPPSGWAVLRLCRRELRGFLDSLKGRKTAEPSHELDKWLAKVMPS